VEPSESGAPAAGGATFEYVSLLSHTLLTPLSGIVLWCDMLRGKPDLPETVKRGLVAIDRSSRAQVAILENLVELSRMQESAKDLHRSRVELVPSVEDVLVRNASAAKHRKIELRFARPPADLVVEGDPVRLRTALYNVLNNAVNASPEGGAVDVALAATPGGVSITITDEGPGIPSDVLPGVLVARPPTEKEVAKRRGALGLGLPIAYRIVQLHGGVLELAPRASRGFACTISLPRAA
jgi:signal transduction histidine kinase